MNDNKFDFGEKQSSEQVNNVILPKWAKGSPEIFISIHKKALESKYVSQHLNDWIDLIFGYKQTGEESEKNNNVFHYLTYEKSVDLDKIKDPIEKLGILSQIEHFGQCPSQLFDKPHPKRDSMLLKRTISYVSNKLTSFVINNNKTNKPKGLNAMSQIISDKALLFIGITENLNFTSQKFIIIDMNRKLYINHLINKDNSNMDENDDDIKKNDENGDQKLDGKEKGGKEDGTDEDGNKGENVNENDKDYNNYHHMEEKKKNTESSNSLSINNNIGKKIIIQIDPNRLDKERIGPSFDNRMKSFSNCFAMSSDGNTIILGGYWGNSFYVAKVDNSEILQTINKHKDVVTSIVIDKTNKFLVTGSKDTTVIIWDLKKDSKKNLIVNEKIRHLLYGHSDEITSIDIDVDLDLVVTGSKNGIFIIYSLLKGRFDNIIDFKSQINFVKIITESGLILICCNLLKKIFFYTINGKFLTTKELSDEIIGVNCTKNEKFVILTTKFGSVNILQIPSFETVIDFSIKKVIKCISLSNDQRFLLFGSNDGSLIVFDWSNLDYN